MAEVSKYRVVLYGSSAQKPRLKAKIELYGSTPAGLVTSLGRVRFHAGGELPADADTKGDWTINLPVETLRDVLELLGNHAKVYFAHHEGRAVLGTGVEPVGARDEAIPVPVKIMAPETKTAADPAASSAPEAAAAGDA